MLTHLQRVISPAQAAELSQTVGPREFTEPLIAPLVELVRNHAPVVTAYPAYCVVEQKSNGHGWHTDTGNRDHMQWCTYSTSVLLSDPSTFLGGCFRTRDDQFVHYLDMLLFSSDVEHAVDPSDGDRRVLLMFFA